jgi:glycyl-tRNA synthetase beta chain
MAEQADFLVEVGTEELPPKALPALAAAFRASVASGLEQARLAHGELRTFATPRRLAVGVAAVALRQPDIESELRGPPVLAAFDAAGKPTRAALAFAAKCGVEVQALTREATAKGAWLVYRGREAGRPAAELLPGIVEAALAALPVPRRMRWGDSSAEFVRPVHWLVMLLGEDVLPCSLLGVDAGRSTRGHRFHAPESIELVSLAGYAQALDAGHVIADFTRRRERVRDLAQEAAALAGGALVFDAALLDEVTALVEWPVPVSGRFDARFLDLPDEVLVATLQDHQRYFPLRSPDGRLMPRFVAISNLDSRDPDAVRRGNERVVVPRLADAEFFYSRDRQTPLAERAAGLAGVVFQKRLGTLADKTARVVALAGRIARLAGGDAAAAERAATLAKCDLLTAMVGEFPELQGTMGRYYARHDGEPPEVAQAIGEQYLPRWSGDALPATAAGRALALADRLDTIAGTFAIGQRPSGTRDPFGIRRAALGVLRILIEGRLDLDLSALVTDAVAAQPVSPKDPALAEAILEYFMERLRGYYLDGAGELTAGHGEFEAVLARRPASPLDFHQRLAAVVEFSRLDAAESLAAANKRIANILRQAGTEAPDAAPDPARLVEPAERALFERVAALAEEVRPLVAARRYRDALERLAALRAPVDRFFDDVLVMADDPQLRRNRLALLARLRGLFMDVADVSRLGA